MHYASVAKGAIANDSQRRSKFGFAEEHHWQREPTTQ